MTEWSRLREWNGSQAIAFEELVCQLAFCEAVPAGSRFVRKGTPDAGVECFWSLPSGEEHGWQAKFFTTVLSPSQWRQVDDSVNTALDKHPILSRYTVAMAIDRADARVGEQKSCLDHWNERVNKWKAWATAKGIRVDFDFWGTHEIAERLSRDQHCGRHFFWFREELLSPSWFGFRLDEAIAAVGPRYTPALNVHVPISAVFDGLSRSPQFLQRFEQAYGEAGKVWSNNSLRVLESHLPEETTTLCQHLTEIVRLSKHSCLPGVEPINWLAIQCKIREALALLSGIEISFYDLAKNRSGEPVEDEETRHYAGQDPFGHARHTVRRIEDKLERLLSFAESDVAQLANIPFLLLVGEAGTGKTHLFSDAASQHADDGAPVVLFIGSRFRDEEPWAQMLRTLGLSCTRDEFLGALEAAAQLSGRRALILVDAINEGTARNAWRTHLASMLTVVSRYPWVAVAVSVRSSYERLIVPDGLIPDKMTRCVHGGFANQEYAAAKAFFDFYGIELPAVPVLTPEFQNPLYPLFYTGRHGGASLSSAPSQRVTAVAVSLRAFLRLHPSLPGEIREEVRLSQAGGRGRGQQVPGLRRPHQGLCPYLLRRLQEVDASSILVQGPLVLSVMPREEGAALR